MQYRVISPISDGGRRIEPGEICDFYGDQAESLLMVGAIEPVDMPFGKKTETDASISERRANHQAQKQPLINKGLE